MHVVGSSAALSSGDHPVVTQCLFVSTLTRKTVKHALAAAKLREDGDCRFSQGQKGEGLGGKTWRQGFAVQTALALSNPYL